MAAFIPAIIAGVSTVGSAVVASNEASAIQERENMNARIAQLNERKDAISLNEDLIETLASNSVAMAAGGIQSSGSAARAQETAKRKANEELSVIRLNSESQQSDMRLRGKQASDRGKAAIAGSLFDVATTSYKTYSKVKRT